MNLVRAFRNEMLRSDSSVPVAHRPKLVTTSLVVRLQLEFMNARLDLLPGFAPITAPVLTFLFTGQDAAITMNSIKIDVTQ